MRYIVKQGFFDTDECFTIYDEQNEMAYYVETHEYLSRYFTCLKNPSDKVVAVMRPGINILNPFYSSFAVYLDYIKDEDDPFMDVKSYFLKNKYSIKMRDGQKIVALFNYEKRSYEMICNNETFGSLTWPSFSFTSTYELNVFKKEFDLICVIIMTMIIRYHDDDRFSIFQERRGRH